ncbi:TIGR03619 family F420-dependent LLM class oxidoreductase (plasmid) [Nocardioides sp. R1-1]|uniref:TIGR03619 family F420-dependent LLM class oxidoreductase n=1 Tax=Nocardioides sp. R1-1 TaxID=3383502 RepID=UPI0038D1B7B9
MNTDEDGIPPLDLARLVEDSGIESLWLPDHSHIGVGSSVPTESKVQYGGGDEEEREQRFKVSPGGLPREYYRNFEQMTTLAAMGAVTSTLRLASGICLVVQRDPFYLAKQIASIDHFTGGRYIFGVGAGAPWNAEELQNHGVNLKKRTGLMLERIEAIKQIWAEDKAEYHGTQVDFAPIFSWPKPKTHPHPPIMMGGTGPTVLDRVLSHADGWFPGHTDDMFDSLGDRIAELRERAAGLGRTVDITLNFGRVECVDQYLELGLDRVVYVLPAMADPSEVRRAVREIADIAEQVRGATASSVPSA